MFNSRNPAFYRNPTGAVPAKSPVHFRINVPRDLKCSAARLVVQDDNWGQRKISACSGGGMDGETHEWWECYHAEGAWTVFLPLLHRHMARYLGTKKRIWG